MSLVVCTHFPIDLDNVTAAWLLHRHGGGVARLVLVPMGKGAPEDEQVDYTVDTGGGQFDHHQSAELPCAAILVARHLGVEETYAPLLGYVDALDRGRWYELPRAIAVEHTLAGVVRGIADVFGDEHGPALRTAWTLLDVVTEMGLDATDPALGQQLPEAFQPYIAARRAARQELEAEAAARTEFVWRGQRGAALTTTQRGFPMWCYAHGYTLAAVANGKGDVMISADPLVEIDLAPIRMALDEVSGEKWFLHPNRRLVASPKPEGTRLTLQDVLQAISDG